MPKYAQIGNKFYTVGEGSQLQQISEQDIIGRRGDVPGGQATLDFIRKEGDLETLDPTQITIGSGGEVLSGGKMLALGGASAFVPKGTSLEQLGALPFNPDFSNYLKETKQSYNFNTGFSGNAQIPSTQQTRQGQARGTIDPATGQFIQIPTTQVNQPGATGGQNQQQNAPGGQIDATVGIKGQTPLQAGGRFGTRQFGRLGNDVYEILSDGSRKKVTEAEFNQKLRAQGLNLEVLPQLDLNDNIADIPAGPPNPDINQDGSPKGPSNFLADYKDIIKDLGLIDIKSQFEAVKKEYQELQDKKNAEILEINDNPWIAEGLRLKQVQKVKDKYELKENTLSNQQKLYESMYEEGIAQAKFLASGVQEDRNKMLDLAQKKQEAEKGIALQQEYEYAKTQGFKKDFFEYQKLKATQFGTEDVGLGVIAKTQKAIQEYKDAGFSRKDIEKQYQDAGKTVPLEVAAALNKLYPIPSLAPETQGSSFIQRVANDIYNIWKGIF